MKQYKKRTVALVLASVVTVVGAFGADNYKNSIMSMEFNTDNSNVVNMTILTKTNYEKSVSAIKKDAVTYVIMLPETNNAMTKMPEISGNVQSVDIKTMPYTTTGSGYTKITVKTSQDTSLIAKKGLYIPSKEKNDTEKTEYINEEKVTNYYSPDSRQSVNNEPKSAKNDSADIQNKVKQFNASSPQNTIDKRNNSYAAPIKSDNTVATENKTYNGDHTNEILLLIMGFILVAISSVYFYIKSKNKIAELLGEQTNFDLNNENPDNKKEQKKSKKIKETIKNLDKMYSKPYISSMSKATMPAQRHQINEPETQISEDTILDLDELFQEKINAQPEETAATEIQEEDYGDLEEFLKGFSIQQAEEEAAIEKEKENEQLFEKYIHDNKLNFTKDDIERINELLKTEISDETIKSISAAAVTNPIKVRPTKSKLLENLVTTYAINQNISFTREDIEALNKLISVELDNSFITDLRTNPQRTITMQKEIEERKLRHHKASDILTLNVKDMLPDLSKALKKQGGRRIESEVKPEVVYYSEGYDVDVLSTKNLLPDLSKHNLYDFDNEYKPSEEIVVNASGYDVKTLYTKDILPDLNEAKLHPEKFETEKRTDRVDEETLLKNIENVTFKPFYDGKEEIEILNEFETPTVSQVEEEMNSFQDFEIIDKESEFYNEVPEYNVTDESIKENESYEDIMPAQVINTNKLSESKNQQKNNVSIFETQFNTILMDGKEYDTIKTINFTKNAGCHLVKNNQKYSVIGFINDTNFILKEYDKLNSENLQARASEKLDNGTTRYIIKIGINKFVLNVSANNMEYIMDLC